MSSQLGQLPVPARDEPFPREGRIGQLEQVALIEQAHLQRAALQQCPNRSRLEGGDPVDVLDVAQGLDLRLADHPALPDQHHAVEPEVLTELGGRW